MTLWRRWLPALLILSLGCSSLLPTTAPPVYYQLEYQPPAGRCPRYLPGSLAVGHFTASSPYDDTKMVVLKSGGRVAFSSGFQWVANPGVLVAEALQRDLSQSRLFPSVTGAGSPGIAPYQLSGHLFVFAWDQAAGASQAVLKVELSLVQTQAPRRVLLHRQYTLSRGPFGEDNAAAFARAMSGAVSDFSQQVQQDLCQVLLSTGEGAR